MGRETRRSRGGYLSRDGACASRPFFSSSADAAVWLHVELRRRAHAPARWLLEAAFPALDRVELFQPDAAGRWQAVRSGDLMPFGERPLAQPTGADGVEHRIGGSVGIARFPHDGDSVETLIRAADRAMYRVKAAGQAQER